MFQGTQKSQKILLIIYKTLNNAGPDYIHDILKPYRPPRDLRSVSQELLAVPRHSTETYGARSFAVAGPKLWNELPLHIRKSQSTNQFKTLLKTHLFNVD